jgi:hypothetical protein
MKRLSIYVWFAAFIFVANAWLGYVFPFSKNFSSEPAPIWQNVLTRIAVVSQLPSFPLSKVIAEFFDLSYPGWAITNSVVSILIYFPLINLVRPWRPGLRVRSISRKLVAFSSSLNPCGSIRKEASNLDADRDAKGSSAPSKP